jgi:hypothetical protein
MVSHDRREDNVKQKNTRWLLRSGNFILPAINKPPLYFESLKCLIASQKDTFQARDFGWRSAVGLC